MQAVARTKIQDIRDKIAPHLSMLLPLDDFTLQRFKREVENNIGVDPLLGNQTRAYLAVLEWDEVGVELWFERAFRISKAGDVYFAYANALQLLGKYPEAAEQARIASERVPENLTYLEIAVVYTHNAGQFEKAAQLVDIYNQRSPGALHRETALMHDATECFKFWGLPSDLPVRCNSIAFGFLRERRIPFVKTMMRIDSDDNSFMFNIGIMLPEDEVLSLDEELGVRLFDQVPDFDPARYWVGFTPVED